MEEKLKNLLLRMIKEEPEILSSIVNEACDQSKNLWLSMKTFGALDQLTELQRLKESNPGFFKEYKLYEKYSCVKFYDIIRKTFPEMDGFGRDSLNRHMYAKTKIFKFLDNKGWL